MRYRVAATAIALLALGVLAAGCCRPTRRTPAACVPRPSVQTARAVEDPSPRSSGHRETVLAMMEAARRAESEGRNRDAVAVYAKVVDHDPTFVPAYWNRARLYGVFLGDYERAHDDLDAGARANEAAPDSPAKEAWRMRIADLSARLLRAASEEHESERVLIRYFDVKDLNPGDGAKLLGELRRAAPPDAWEDDPPPALEYRNGVIIARGRRALLDAIEAWLHRKRRADRGGES